MARYTKGQSGNPNGRPKGVPNKSTDKVRQAIADYLDNQSEKIEGYVQRVAENDPDKALDFFVKLSEFCIPKLSRQDVNQNNTGDIQINITRKSAD